MQEEDQPTITETSLHLLLRGCGNRQCFDNHVDCHFFLQCLQTYAEEFSCAVHAYVLMNSHAHLLLTPKDEKKVTTLIRQLIDFHTSYVTRTYHKNGPLWQEIFERRRIKREKDFLSCHKYIELDPVRSGSVMHPAEYPWSSYRANAHGMYSSLLTPHPHYLRLGNSRAKRLRVYRDMFGELDGSAQEAFVWEERYQRTHSADSRKI